MPKIRINYELKSSDKVINKDLLGIKKDTSILFQDDDFSTNISIIDNNIIMKRENHDSIISISLGSINKCNILMKEYNKEIDVDIKLKKLLIDSNQIYFKYDTLDNSVEFKIRYEVTNNANKRSTNRFN